MSIKYRETIPPFIQWNRVKRIREHLRMSRDKFARAVEISTQYVFMIEANGSLSDPSKEIKERIRKVFSKELKIVLEISDLFPANVMNEDVELVKIPDVIF